MPGRSRGEKCVSLPSFVFQLNFQLDFSQLALQSTFHGPLAYPLPYPPRPIFQRVRPPRSSEVESGLTYHEFSFYKNTYAMVCQFLLFPSCHSLLTSVIRSPFIVHRLDILSGVVLLLGHQTEYYPVFNRPSVDSCSCGVCAGFAGANDAQNCSEAGDMAGQCCCRRIILGSVVRF